MPSLSHCIDQLLRSLDADSAKLLRIAMNNNVYKRAIEGIWKDRDASKLILDHTNAFYLRQEEGLRKGMHDSGSYAVCEVCIDDPLVRAEVDTHRELLAFALRSNGLEFEELRIIASKQNMRKRHPFISEGGEVA